MKDARIPMGDGQMTSVENQERELFLVEWVIVVGREEVYSLLEVG